MKSLAVLFFASLLSVQLQVVLCQSFDCKQLLKTAKYRNKSFTGCQVLAARKAIAIWYATDAANGKNGDIVIRFSIRETDPQLRGWMGLGFSDMGAMTGSDIIIIHKKETGTGYTATDAYAIGFQTPIADKSQDVVLLDYKNQRNVMTATFTRKLKTCDADEDHEIQRGLGQFMIWAHGQVAGPGFSGIMYHGTTNRGYLQRQMLDLLPKKGKGTSAVAAAAAEVEIAADSLQQPQQQPETPLVPVGDANGVTRLSEQLRLYYNPGVPADGSDSTINPSKQPQQQQQQQQQQAALATVSSGAIEPAITPLPNIKDNGDGTYETDILCKVPEIPAVETTYINCYVRLPDDKRYHITSYTTIFGNRKLVHHSVVYACLRENAEPQVIDLIANTGAGPYNQNQQRMLCEVFYMVGPSPNAPTYTLPDTTGLPFGKDSYRYFAIEVHYNNPEYLSGQSDPGTGLTLRFQDANKRPNDVGILTISQFILDIPAGQETVLANRTICSNQCIGRFKQPVTLISQFLHMHGLGRGVKTSRVRNNIELQPLATLRAFDYGYQTWVDIPDSQQILYPNDELTMQCIFDSRSRSSATHWGFGTQDEMCFWWIYYYPAQPGMGICNSLGDTDLVLCSDDVSDLQNLKDASDTGNDTLVLQQVDKIRMADRGINAEAQPVYVQYDPTKGCSATPPKV